MSFEDKVNSGKFAVLGEFQPPKGADFSSLLEAANQVRGRVAAIVVPELAVAVLKASSLGGCAFLQNNGFETIMQICTRDRNRLALQADILAAAALGVRNMMGVKGEDITHGDHHQAREVRDLDLDSLFTVMHGLKAGKDMAGITVSDPPDFCMGAEINIGSGDSLLDAEIERLNRLADLGVRFIITSPVFDLKRFTGFVSRIDTDRLAVIPSVLVLKSAGMAKYVNRNLRNINVPKEMVSRLEKAPDRERLGLKIAGELTAQLKNIGVAGALISTRGWEKRLPQILDNAGL